MSRVRHLSQFHEPCLHVLVCLLIIGGNHLTEVFDGGLRGGHRTPRILRGRHRIGGGIGGFPRCGLSLVCLALRLPRRIVRILRELGDFHSPHPRYALLHCGHLYGGFRVLGQRGGGHVKGIGNEVILYRLLYRLKVNFFFVCHSDSC